MKLNRYISLFALTSVAISALYSCSSTNNEHLGGNDYATLTVFVKDAQDGLLLDNVTLKIDETQISAKYNGNGEYKFENLEFIPYDISASKIGYLPKKATIPIERKTQTTTIELGKEIVTNVQGIVKTDNKPLADAYVYLIPTKNKGAKVEVHNGTDKDGRFSFTGLTDGETYKLFVFKEGYRSVADREITVPDNETNIQLAPKTAESISFDKIFMDMGESGNMAVFGINTGANKNLSWELISDACWITFDLAGNIVGDASVVIEVDRNYLSGKNNDRSAKVIVKASDGKSDEIWVIVSGAGSGLNIGDIITLPIKDITPNSAIASCIFLDESLKENAKQIGVCYSTVNIKPAFEQDESESTELSMIGSDGVYNVPLMGLSAGETYYIRGYVLNKTTNKLHYSPNVRSFKTESHRAEVGITTFTTTSKTATLRAEIINAGTPEYIECGFYVTPSGKEEYKIPCSKNPIFTSTIEIELHTLYRVKAYADNKVNEVAYGEECSFKVDAYLPQITTHKVDNITSTSANFYGEITDVGIYAYHEKGYLYSSQPDPDKSGTKVRHTESQVLGNFSSVVSGLQPLTRHYVCAYATNNIGSNYGEIKEFLTGCDEPVLTQPTILNTAATMALIKGSITFPGHPTYVERGFCYSTNREPTITNKIPVEIIILTGDFSMNLTGLLPNTKYYIRAYTINSANIVTYSPQKSFTTNMQVFDVDGNAYEGISVGTQVWLNKNLMVTKFNDGTVIPQANLSAIPEYSWYGKNSNNKIFLGALYNAYVVENAKNICPTGWHVPTQQEWQILENYFGGMEVAGGALKWDVYGDVSWEYPNIGATNISGLSFVGGGVWNIGGQFVGKTQYGMHWSSTKVILDDQTQGLGLYVVYNSAAALLHASAPKIIGASIRCMKD